MSKTVVLARPYPFIATEMRPLLEGLGYQKKPDLLADLDNMVGGAAGAVVSLALSSPIPLQTCPMCGPTLVVKRDRQPGQHIYCRNCSGEFKLMPAQKGLHAQPTGGMGPPGTWNPNWTCS